MEHHAYQNHTTAPYDGLASIVFDTGEDFGCNVYVITTFILYEGIHIIDFLILVRIRILKVVDNELTMTIDEDRLVRDPEMSEASHEDRRNSREKLSRQ